MNKFADIIVLGSAVYHLIMGGACVLSRRQISLLAKFLYNMQLPEKWDPLAEYALKPLGAFAIWTGIVCGVAYFLPGPWSPFIKLGLALLFSLRAAFRYFYRDVFLNSMGIPWKRSRINVVFNIALVLALLMAVVQTGF